MNYVLASIDGILSKFSVIAEIIGITLAHPPTPAHLWLIFGLALCLMELALPTAFVAFIMGLSAILVSVIALFIPNISIQLFIWLFLSTVAVIFSRRWLSPKRKTSTLTDDHEGTTITEIPVGEAGRVLYEGNSWRAICADEKVAIAANQTVYIVKRKGNTLIVIPENFSSLSSHN